MWTYQLRYVRCGKENCSRCWNGPSHGPYWYGYERVGDRVRSKYFGKRPPNTYAPPPPQAPPVSDRWTFHGRMDLRAALRIMGFATKPNAADLSKRYRTLIMEHHPDHGGSTAIAAAIIAAYSYLK